MKNLLLLIVLCISSVCLGQDSLKIYKGLYYGMTKSEAVSEFTNNKTEYVGVDLGNGFVWTTYKQNLLFYDGILVGITFVPEHPLSLSCDNATLYLEYTKAFFENKDYTIILEPEDWQYPFLFHGVFGLVLSSPAGNVVVQLYPGTYVLNHSTYCTASLKILNKSWFISQYNHYKTNLKEKADLSGF